MTNNDKSLRWLSLLSNWSFPPQVQEMLVARKTRTREALTLMWCAGQLPDKNLAQGLRGLHSELILLKGPPFVSDLIS